MCDCEHHGDHAGCDVNCECFDGVILTREMATQISKLLTALVVAIAQDGTASDTSTRGIELIYKIQHHLTN